MSEQEHGGRAETTVVVFRSPYRTSDVQLAGFLQLRGFEAEVEVDDEGHDAYTFAPWSDALTASLKVYREPVRLASGDEITLPDLRRAVIGLRNRKYRLLNAQEPKPGASQNGPHPPSRLP